MILSFISDAIATQWRTKLAKIAFAGGLSLSNMQLFFSSNAFATTSGIEQLEGESQRIFMKAQSAISDGDFKTAQGFFEQVVEVEPTAIYAWSNLGNVLVSQGNLDQALLCYKKAISLQPRRDQLGVIVLNRASVEMSLGMNNEAIRDLTAAERLTGPTPEIVTNKAVALTNEGEWNKAATLFEEIIKTSDRDALPWWLRYSEALLETGRGTEAVAFLQRTLNRFPYENDCKGFAVALYSSLGSKIEAQRYWKTMDDDTRKLYSDASFYTTKLKWGPKTIAGFTSFISSNYANVMSKPNTAIRQGSEITIEGGSISSRQLSTLITAKSISKAEFISAAKQGDAIDLRKEKVLEERMANEMLVSPPAVPIDAAVGGGVRVIDLGGNRGARGLASNGVQGPSLVEQLKAFGGPGAAPSSAYGSAGYEDKSFKNPFVYKEGIADQLGVFQKLAGEASR